ncbi:MAG TPA: PilX N-terminal domain-containing pilus assembly protein [Steroidobacteraceae bacterium]|nr:PilX N-terminal domain-containing pilus assembly protein [Steroidobacteraceae bacterium]
MSAPALLRRRPAAARERGIALVTSLLLLIIITILALSMFRSFGSQERIAGNIREKDRALHAAETAQQYAEWWLLQGNNISLGATACQPPAVSANTNPGQICNQTLPTALGFAATAPIITVPMPWTMGFTYTPPNMSTTPGVNGGPNGQDPPYFAPPGFYIADVGPANDGAGEAYQIDAYGYGGASTTIAIVESTYEVQQGVTCLSCG